jgi:S1-C subfamily serine protease
MFNFLSGNINRKRERVYRFITHSSNNYTVGSGFFISKHGGFLTCFHVAFKSELRQIRQNPDFQKITGNDEHSKLKVFYKTLIIKSEVEFPDSSRYVAELIDFDERFDIAFFKVRVDPSKVKVCRIDWNSSFNYTDNVFFGGFPTQPYYQSDKFPFAVHEGIVSSFVEMEIGGSKYQHVMINSVNLGGNSGAPLFRRRGSGVMGIINGNMNWGRDDLIGQDKAKGYVPVSLRTPLSIAYATPMKLLKEFIFETLKKCK